MKLIGLMPCRNEDWVLGLSARVALMWCDELVMLNHESRDRTHSIIRGIEEEFGYKEDGGRVTYLAASGAWHEMKHRQEMLRRSREFGATHIAIIDADEILTGNFLSTIRSNIESFPQGSILQLPGYNLRGSLNQYHSNGIWGRRWFSLAFRDHSLVRWEGDTFHRREPLGVGPCVRMGEQGTGGVMHLWGVSERRLRAKHALYKLTERLRWPQKAVQDIDRMYSWAIHGRPEAGDGRDRWTFAQVPEHWWKPYEHLMHYLNVDADPWQEAECRRLVAEHSAAQFAGLDLFDVA